jgi:hypothetical protein
LENTAMNRTAVYVTLAIFLGLATTLLPSWVFLSRAANDPKPSVQFASEGLPFIDAREQNHVELVSSKEVGVLGSSFLVALAVYGIFRRRTRPHDYVD